MPISNSYTQVSYRFRNDDGSETTATWIAAADTDTSISLDTNFRLRIKVNGTGQIGWTDLTWNLYYSLNGGAYTAVTGSSPVKFSASSNITDGQDATEQLAYIYSFLTDNNGIKETTGGVINSSGSLPKSFEVEWCLTLDGTQVSSNNTLDFRIYRGTTALNSYTVTPRATATGGSSQNLTLTCAAGSYSLTGTDCTLTHTPASQNLTLACSAGSYSLTGTNADITSSRTLVCEPASGGAYPDIIVSGAGTSDANGTWAYTGLQDGKPFYELNGRYLYWSDWFSIWIISFSEGDYYYSYDDVATPDLVTTWQINGGAQLPVPTVTIATTYTLTGSDVTLTYTQGAQSYTLTCEAGSYSLTGSNVDFVLQRNYTLVCGVGSYSLTGTNTTLEVKRNYTLVCEAGSYALTGTDITFGNSKAYSLTCEAGAYTITGSNVSFVIQRNYSLACETGSYSLTGTDANLVLLRNYILACEPGSYALTGTNAGLTSARTMALEPGSYALTGTNGDFYRALVMACEAGSYALTGTDASLTSHRIFALGMGSYVLVGTACGLFILSPTPACRTATIEFENRTFAIPHENRTATIEFENRTFAIPHENRTATIEYENRTLEVTCH